MNTSAEVEQDHPDTEKAMVIYRDILLTTITDQPTCASMVGFVKQMKDEVKEIVAWFAPMMDAAKAVVAKAQEAVDAVKTRQTEATSVFSESAVTGQAAINKFLTDERLRVQTEELKARETAAVNKKLAEDELKASATLLEGLGQTTQAAALRQEAALVIAAPVFVPTIDKTIRTGGGRAAGGATMSQTVKITAQVTDVKLFLAYLVSSGSAATFVEFPKAKLNAWVVSNGIKAGEVPGLAIEETVTSRI